MSPISYKRRQHQLKIVDRARLAEAVRELIKAHDNQQTIAASKLRITYEQLSHWIAEDHGHMSLGEFDKLAKHMTPEIRGILQGAFFTPEASNAMSAYRVWQEEYLSPSDEELDGVDVQERMALFERIESLGPCRYYIKEFVKLSNERRVSHDRIRLAIRRILKPMLEHAASGKIERDWRELSDDELEAMVKHGLEYEAVLLNRSMSFFRAQQLDQNSLH